MAHKKENMKTFQVKLTELVPSKIQPDSRVSNKKAKAMAESFEKFGQLQPIVVRPVNAGGKRKIIIGHTRAAAAVLREQATIAAVELDVTEAEAREIFISEACSVQKVDAYQWLGVWKKGCPLKELPPQHQRSIEYCQKVFGDGLEILFEHHQAPTCGKLIHETYLHLGLELGQETLPSLREVGEWFVICKAYQDVQYVSRSGWHKKDAERILSCIRKMVPFKDKLPRGRAPKLPKSPRKDK